jgi:NAD(P)-dependent dehydrogenase (short-subunit alcohol dehydrogenase family)
MGRLDGKTAVILGAAGRDNMAQCVARRFSREGAQIMLAGRHLDELRRFAAEIGGWAASCDITNAADLEDLATRALEKLGSVSIAINATGLRLPTRYLTATRADLEKVTAVQFIGPYQFFQSMINVMTNGGSLIQISSAAAAIMLNDYSAYMGTKAGFDHVIRCIANEFGDRGIRANSISPGSSEEVAAAAVWLASDECFLTGQNLQINGGLTLRGNPTPDAIGAAIAAAGGPGSA